MVLALEREVTVSFVQNRYNVKEGDQLNVRFVVMGPSTASFEVRVTSSNGTAFSKFTCVHCELKGDEMWQPSNSFVICLLQACDVMFIFINPRRAWAARGVIVLNVFRFQVKQ